MGPQLDLFLSVVGAQTGSTAELTTPLSALGDSLDLLELIMYLEDEFKVDLPDETVESWGPDATLQHLFDLVVSVLR